MMLFNGQRIACHVAYTQQFLDKLRLLQLSRTLIMCMIWASIGQDHVSTKEVV